MPFNQEKAQALRIAAGSWTAFIQGPSVTSIFHIQRHLPKERHLDRGTASGIKRSMDFADK
jgi:hypothetical protein